MKFRNIAAFALPFMLISSTNAASMTSIKVNTGVDANASKLAAGSIDPFWTISTDGIHFSSAKVAYPGVYPAPVGGTGQICCGMESVSADAAWITTSSVVSNSPTTGWGVNNTVYARRTFDLSGFDLNTVSMSGNWRVADNAYGIYVNGHLISGTKTQAFAFAQNQAFSVEAASGFFVSGINTLELRGQSVNNIYDAFWLAETVQGQMAAVPEPETYALMIAGLGLVGFAARRR